jgi:hypothetical protein
MTAHPHLRTRFAGPVTAVMILLVLAAALLYSTASPYHRHHGHSHAVAPAVLTAYSHAAALAPDVHEHRHGNEWVPSLGQRFRPTGALSLATGAGQLLAAPVILAVGAVEGGRAAPPPSSSGLSLLGVLRV